MLRTNIIATRSNRDVACICLFSTSDRQDSNFVAWAARGGGGATDSSCDPYDASLAQFSMLLEYGY